MSKDLTGPEKFEYLKTTVWKANKKNWFELKQEDREAVEAAYVEQKIKEEKEPKVEEVQKPKKGKYVVPADPIVGGGITDRAPAQEEAEITEPEAESDSDSGDDSSAPDEDSSEEEVPELPDPTAPAKKVTKLKKSKARF